MISMSFSYFIWSPTSMNMSQFSKTTFAFVFLILFNWASCGEKYTTKWDNINVDEILGSDRLLENYKKCLMDEGKCTPDGQELKNNLPDALKTECSKCSEKQKENTEKVINYLMDEKRNWWEELQKKYDPTGIYYKRRLDKLSSNQYNPSTSTTEKTRN